MLIVTALLLPGLSQAAAVTEEDFKVQNTQSLLNLCTADDEDPNRDKAIHFCHGYLVGAFHYYVAENDGPSGRRLMFFPDPPPTRNSAIQMFLEWANARPQYNNERPVETEFRFLIETWPCKE